MCRFKLRLLCFSPVDFRISIHLMCRFKIDDKTVFDLFRPFQYILCVGSSGDLVGKAVKKAVFQYILCVGSSLESLIDMYSRKAFQYILCVGSSPKTISLNSEVGKFQYILCVGSSRA